MTSRWGAKPDTMTPSRWGASGGTGGGNGSTARNHGTTITTTTTTTTEVTSIKMESSSSTEHNTNNKDAEPNWFDNSDDDTGFEVIDQVLWANDEKDPQSSGLAFRPKPDYCDPCDCLPPDSDDDEEEDDDDEDDEEETSRKPKPKKRMACMDMSCVLFACQEECRSTCLAGAACGNKRIQRKQWKGLQVFDAGKKGKGLKVTEECQKGELITEYVGKAIPKSYLPRLFQKYKRDRKLYIMALDKDVYLDAREKGGLARYINHSCDPNCVVERWKVRGIIRAAIFALKTIPAHTELSFDYQWERKRGRAPTKCHCGSTNCRGTLEVPRSMEDLALEKKLVGHWKKPFLSRAGREIVNRSIQVFHELAQEYYAADVTQYNEATGQHLVMYRHDLEEVWEDLKHQDWMILDEEAEQFFIIGKKKGSGGGTVGGAGGGGGNNEQRSLLSECMIPQPQNTASNTTGNGNGYINGGDNNYYIKGEDGTTMTNGTTTGPSAIGAGVVGLLKNYLYVQTPIKEAFFLNHHILDRCQRSCRVTITPQQFAKPPLLVDPNSPEDVDKHRALEQTLDGTVWKLTIVGSDIAKAYSIVERNCLYLEKKLQQEEAEQVKKNKLLNAGTEGGGGGGIGTGGGMGGGVNDVSALSGGTGSGASDHNSAEVVFPRCIVSLVKKRLNVIRETCRSVTITFVPSESKSKQFAKLILEGTLLSDVQSAKENLWTQLLAACVEAKAPMTPMGIPKDLGFFGGELSSIQFQRLVDYDKTTTTTTTSIQQRAKKGTTTPGTPSNISAFSSNSSFSMLNSADTTAATTTTTAASANTAGTSNTRSTSPTTTAFQQDAQEDLARRSPFFNSFESTQRCTIWVQADLDKGRIDGSNRVVNEAVPHAPRKIYFGCDPKDVPKLWGLVQTRALEVARGVKYLYLGPDRMYQPHMMRKGGQFFEFVRKSTGASVTVDSMTGDHLRIDGRGRSNAASMADLVEGTDLSAPIPTSTLSTEGLSEGERAVLAEELIRLQIELYRDHCIREQNCIFGRDWTLVRRSSTKRTALTVDALAAGNTTTAGGGSNNNQTSVSNSKPFSSAAASSSRSLQFDAKTMSNACLEIADITSTLGVGGSVGAHAVVILYRFASVLTAQTSLESQLKIREVILACLFIANKSLKLKSSKRLEEVLEAAYSTFYPGAKFDRSKEEALVLEEKVVSAEAEILATLDYDVFWRGTDWIASAATESGGMQGKLARHAMRFCCSGPVLAAGPDLWLLYGAEYVFAAASGFLEASLETLCRSLSLIPLKVAQAAELIANSVKLSGQGKRGASHPLLQEGKEALLEHLPRIKSECLKCMSQGIIGGDSNELNCSSESEQRYRIIGARNRKRSVFRNVEASIVKDRVLPTIDGVSAESNCSIFIEESQGGGGGEDIILEGSWRAVAIAAYLLEEAVGGRKLENAVSPDNQIKVQAKGHSGLLQMQNIETSDAWAGTIQAQGSSKSFMGRKTGGKCCVPGKITESGLRDVGLRWWIPPRYGPSPTGSICDMFLAKSNASEQLDALANLTHAFVGDSPGFSMLTSALEKSGRTGMSDRYVAVSLQRWPGERVARKEEKKTKKESMQMGFSAMALQEMQLLKQLHSLIRSPQGHPNFVLPVGVALPSEVEEEEKSPLDGAARPFDLNRIEDDIFSLTRTSEENEVAAQEERKRKDMVTGPHIVFHPTPFVLSRFLVRQKSKRSKEADSEDRFFSVPIISSWFHDLLSALVHCHTNNVLIRTLQADHIVVDHSGVGKLGNLYRGLVFSADEKKVDIVDLARSQKDKPMQNEEELILNPFVAPEILLGSPKHTKQSDVWAMGCLLASLLLNKPLFQAKDLETKLLAIYKIVGTPAADNYPEAVNFPKYAKPTKKYAPGVVKALQYMLKEEESKKHAGAIELVGRMLQLDPDRRITAVDALADVYMLDYIENTSNSESFRQEYVQDWMGLKEKLLRSNQSEEDELKARERGIKRKAMLIAAATKTVDDEEDDLYDMGDLLNGGDGEPSKKQQRN
jgi:serine/threonine protein kinase